MKGEIPMSINQTVKLESFVLGKSIFVDSLNLSLWLKDIDLDDLDDNSREEYKRLRDFLRAIALR